MRHAEWAKQVGFPPSPVVDYAISPAGRPVLCRHCRDYFRLFTNPNGIVLPRRADLQGPCAFHRSYKYPAGRTSDGVAERDSLDLLEEGGPILSPATEYALAGAVTERSHEAPPVTRPASAVGKKRELLYPSAPKLKGKKKEGEGDITFSLLSSPALGHREETYGPATLKNLVAESEPEYRPHPNRVIHPPWPHEQRQDWKKKNRKGFWQEFREEDYRVGRDDGRFVPLDWRMGVNTWWA